MTTDAGRDGQELVHLANDMLSQLHVATRVQHWTEISTSVFVTLFEGLCGEALPDVIRTPRCKEDEIHNCQSVIDTLSLDILNTSLSHITGEDVVNCDKHAISNLLEVLSGLLEYIIDKIVSDVSTDNEGEDRDDIQHDPDLVTSEVIDDILEKELGHSYKINGTVNGVYNGRSRDTERSTAGHSWLDVSSKTGNSTDDLIALGNVESSWTSHPESSPDKTSDLIALGLSPPSRGPKGDLVSNDLTNGTTSASKNSTSDLIKESQQLLRSANGFGRDPTNGKLSELATSIDRVGNGSGPVLSGKSPKEESSALTLDALNSSMGSSVTYPKEPVIENTGTFNSRQFDNLGVRPRPETDKLSSSLPLGGSNSDAMRSGVHHTYTHHLYHHYDPKDPLSASLPITSTFGKSATTSELSGSSRNNSSTAYKSSTASKPPLANKEPTLRGTVTAPSSARTQIPSSVPQPRLASTAPVHTSNGLNRNSAKTSQSFENLENLMRDTVEISRAAVRSSPLRERPVSANAAPSQTDTGDSRYRGMSRALRSALQEVEKEAGSVEKIALKVSTQKSKEKARVARDMRHSNVTDSATAKSILSPGRKNAGKKNVSFNTNKSLSSSENSLDRGLASRNIRSTKPTAVRDSTHRKTTHQQTTRNSSPQKVQTIKLLSTHPPPAAKLPADHKPRTFKEYLNKYYGRDRIRSHSEGEEGYDSDGVVDYLDRARHDSSQDADISDTLSAELEEYKRQLHKAKAVRFDDILDDSAPGRMGGIRRKLKGEDQKGRVKAAFIDKVYQSELIDYEDEMSQRLRESQKKAQEIEKLYKQKVLKEPKTKHKPAKVYATSVLTPRNRSRTRSRNGLGRSRKRSYSASPSFGRKKPLHVSDHEILPWLLEEFPYLHLSPETLHDMWYKSARQIEQLSKAEREVKNKRSHAQVQIDEAEKKQTIVMNIMKKELQHNQKMREVKERRKQVQSVKAKIRDKRQQSARCRKYYEEYQIRNRSKMLRKRGKEELVFKKLFKEGLDIQKERIGELRRYAREQRQQRSKKQQDELESLENYYKDQFAMLAESMARERVDIEVRETAQSKVLETMKKELRRKMEREISDFQEQLYRDEDDAYFRELDAERLRHQLHMARYQTKV